MMIANNMNDSFHDLSLLLSSAIAIEKLGLSGAEIESLNSDHDRSTKTLTGKYS